MKTNLPIIATGIFLAFSTIAIAQTNTGTNERGTTGTTGNTGTTKSTKSTETTKETKGSKQKDKDQAMSSTDKTFLMSATNGSYYEIEAAKFVMEKSTDSDVKDYAKMMRTDHSKAYKELCSIMSDKSINAPKEVTGEEKTMLDQLKKATGKELESTYKQQMVTSHRKTVKLYEDANNTVKDQKLKNHVSATLPVLKKHLEHAEHMNNEKSPTK